MIRRIARQPASARHGRQPSPCGYTLIEILVVITLCATLSGAAVAAMAALLRVDDGMTEYTRQRAEMWRLCRELRSDVHGAAELEWDAEQQVIALQRSDGTAVRYEVMAGRWIRLIDREGDSPMRTSLGVSDMIRCDCEPATASQGDLVRMHFRRATVDEDTEDEPTRRGIPWEIVATVGRDGLPFSE